MATEPRETELIATGQDEAQPQPERPSTEAGTSRPAKGSAAGKGKRPVKKASGFSTLRSKLALGADERKTKPGVRRPGNSAGLKTVLVALSVLGNVVAITVAGWFLYAKDMPGNHGAIAGLKLYHPDASGQVETREERTARQFVEHMMNIDYHNLDSFGASVSTGISGDLKKSTSPEQVNTLKQLFAELQVVAKFTIVSTSVVEDHPDSSVVAVAGVQTLNLKGDKGERTQSTILDVTVEKKDQSVSKIESQDSDRKNPADKGAGLLPLPTQGGQNPQPGKAPQEGPTLKSSQAPQQAPVPKQP